MKNLRFALVFALAFQALAITPLFTQDINRSYFVRSDGNDIENNGRSEDAPFQTLEKAIEMASKGAVKKITIIGKIEHGTQINDSGSTEIIITGKQDPLENEVATISNGRGTIISVSGNSRIRFENISFTKSGHGLTVEGLQSIVTLGKGTSISSCSWLGTEDDYDSTETHIYNFRKDNIFGTAVVLSAGSSLIMEADAMISGNGDHDIDGYDKYGFGGGVYIDGSTLIMKDSASITKNISDVGGGVYIQQRQIKVDDKKIIMGSLIMQGNSSLSNNTAKWGGGVFALGDLIVQDCASISGNEAENGGGIFRVNGQIILKGKSTISNNNAKHKGGGVYCGDTEIGLSTYSPNEKDSFIIQDQVIITENTGKAGGGIYISGGQITINGGGISKNKADYGAGIYADIFKNRFREGKSKVTITNCDIKTNVATFVGGGIYAATGSLFSISSSAKNTGNMAGDGEGLDIFYQK